MKNIRKVFVCVLAAAMVLGFAGCKKKTAEATPESIKNPDTESVLNDELQSQVDRTWQRINGVEDGSEGLEYEELERIVGDGPNALQVNGIGSCTDVNIVIPREIDGMRVIQINHNAFENNTNIKSVTLCFGVIGEGAFAGCTSLEDICFIDPDTQYYSFGKGSLPAYDPSNPTAWTINGEDPLKFMAEHDISTETLSGYSVFAEG